MSDNPKQDDPSAAENGPDTGGTNGERNDGSAPDGGDGPQITLDRYLSRRRPPVRSNWIQIVSMVAMLVALVMIIMYKDRCGQLTSGFMKTMQPASQQQGPSPRR